jgi:hypothetical protein
LAVHVYGKLKSLKERAVINHSKLVDKYEKNSENQLEWPIYLQKQ